MLVSGEEVYCVYKIKNAVNSKIYVGTTNCIEIRWRYHKIAMGTGKSKNQLYQDMRAYGKSAFSIESIEENIPSGLAHKREAYWIDRLNSTEPHGYNMDRGSLKRKEVQQ